VLHAGPNAPEPGCYRIRAGEVWLGVRIWEREPDQNGEIVLAASLGAYVCELRTVWPRCAATPVSSAAYRYWQEKGKWPDDVQQSDVTDGNNFIDAPTLEKISARIAELEAEAIAWFESIGSAITTQDHADRAANYAEAFLELEKQAKKVYVEATKPAQQELVRLKSVWTPIANKAALNKRQIKTFWLLPSGFERAGSGPGKRAGLTVRRFAAFTDLRAFLRWLGDPNLDVKLSTGIKDAALRLARRVLRDHDAEVPPGVEVKEEETMR
jgi:hypothetical protein